MMNINPATERNSVRGDLPSPQRLSGWFAGLLTLVTAALLAGVFAMIYIERSASDSIAWPDGLRIAAAIVALLSVADSVLLWKARQDS